MGAVIARIKTKACAYAIPLKALMLRGTLPETYRNRVPSVFLWFYDHIKILYFAVRITHVFGPKRITYGKHEAIVLCLVKNGEVWIKEFIEHYFGKGFKHIVFLDNGSDDNTLRHIKRYNNVTILKTKMPFKDNNILFKRYMIRRFSKLRWSLTVDVDELWDYPFSEKIELETLLRYLDRNGTDALVAQMLDMFMPQLPTEKVKRLNEYRYYDISSIKKAPFNSREGIETFGFYSSADIKDNIKFFRGGIRAQLFNHTGIWLTKMPLIFYNKRIKPFEHQHFSNNAKIGDITSVLFHYKFTHLFKAQIKSAERLQQYYGNSMDYRQYGHVLRNSSNVNFKQPTAKSYNSIENLVEEDFLVVSPSYLGLVREKTEKKGSEGFLSELPIKFNQQDPE